MPKSNVVLNVCESFCPACGHFVAVDFFSGGCQPLATLAWPKTREEALALPRYPVNFVRCVHCGHIYNPDFRYENVPYSIKPNLMFNKGADWSVFIANIQQRLISFLQDSPTIIEIGYGDGSFLYGLSQLLPNARLVGFDPHGAKLSSGRIDLRNELFMPERHIAELRPSLIVSRHVLEHLVNPVGFLECISFYVSHVGLDVLAYLEVPCVDNMLETSRTVDLYYEHSSQFTLKSFSTMLSRCGANVLKMDKGYDGEVVFAIIELGNDDFRKMALESINFKNNASVSLGGIQRQIEALIQSGRSIAIWGGTGKAAAFINRYNCDAERFPIVVDSDPEKVGTYVPGAGQQIRFYDYLKDNPVDVIIVPPQWRAKDILQEMKCAGIYPQSILIEYDCRLVDYIEYAHLGVGDRPNESTECSANGATECSPNGSIR